MIEMRRRQLNFGDGLIAGEVSDLREACPKAAWLLALPSHLADSKHSALLGSRQ